VNERVEPDRHVRSRGEAATDTEREAGLITAADRSEPDVVDFRVRAPVPASGDRDLELPWEVREIRVAVHVAIDGDRDR